MNNIIYIFANLASSSFLHLREGASKMVPNDLTSWYVHPVQSSPPECGGDQMTHS